MFSGVFIKSKTTPKYLALLGIFTAFVFNAVELLSHKPIINLQINEMLRFDNFNLTFIAIMLLCTMIYFLLSGSEFEKVGAHVGEYFALIFFVLCGVTIAASFNTLLMLFIGIEIISIPLYILTASDKRNLKSNEAALKYFLMGAFSTGILLMGIAFIYGGNENASFYIDKIQIGVGHLSVMIAVGLLFILISLSFKVSAAPFHFGHPMFMTEHQPYSLHL